MSANFKISGPIAPTSGDYIGFVVESNGRVIEGRISGTALRKLAGAQSYDSQKMFEMHRSRIQGAVEHQLRLNPTPRRIYLTELTI